MTKTIWVFNSEWCVQQPHWNKRIKALAHTLCWDSSNPNGENNEHSFMYLEKLNEIKCNKECGEKCPHLIVLKAMLLGCNHPYDLF